MRIGKKWGYADRQGKLVITATFSNAMNFHKGQAMVNVRDVSDCVGGVYPLINRKGKIVGKGWWD